MDEMSNVQATTRFLNKITVLGNDVGIGHYCVIQTDGFNRGELCNASIVGLIGRDAHTTDHVGLSMFHSREETISYRHQR